MAVKACSVSIPKCIAGNMNTYLYRRNELYTDADLTFLVHTFRDAPRLVAMLDSVRSWYPGARIVVCSDGDENPELPEIASAVSAEYHLGKSLYTQGNGGKICQRMLELFLQRPSRYFFKVDPDTGFHRRFAFLPDCDGMFGTVQSHSLLCSIQGGCQGMTLSAATLMHESKIFLDQSLLDPPQTWATYPPLWNYLQKVQRVSSDWIFGYVATLLGIPQFGFAEVMSKWRTEVANPNLRYAITHPVRY